MADDRERTDGGGPAEHRSPEARRAHELRQDPGMEAPAREGRRADGVLVQVCMECGKEYHFDEEPPETMTCEKCGNQVFRAFFAPLREDDVEADYRESTERDLATDDPEGDASRGDVLDLNNP